MIWLVLPAYNEVLSIEPLFSRFSSVQEKTGERFKVLLVDDGSSDGTSEKARLFATKVGLDLVLVVHEKNSGLGETVKTPAWRIFF
jgi:glycosyltransferase involved in cell wall biosynthesis